MTSSVATNPKALYVFQAPVRLWHWTNALSIVTLAITGYLIANPLPSVGGEASDHFMMGTLRLIHFIAAYVFAIGFAARVYWALVGNRYSRQIFFPRIWRGEWWRNFFHELRFYLFLSKDAPILPAHNPLAQTAMFLFNVLGAIFMICTGFALYSQGLGDGSWADRMFGWVIAWFGSSQTVRMWHLMGMWLMVTFAILHIYMAIRADVVGRQSSVSAILSGWRMRRGD